MSDFGLQLEFYGLYYPIYFSYIEKYNFESVNNFNRGEVSFLKLLIDNNILDDEWYSSNWFRIVMGLDLSKVKYSASREYVDYFNKSEDLDDKVPF
ncbi:hypothetical protein FEDK69T_18670 [Flavobacterium enshiense DK69]|uniref:Uncharacterized protein n=1 Tax=Flavobacterium enshiense DK69 TaxID=1107311 RepID=V6S7I0_9FLAO|nr:hypothetical protein FEDK69T_18670 [Flavobacterium enshiense DK69]KGO95676.1 hypothetical protein Q767_10690 [Flavobacterium enshiense DK69]